MSENADVNLKDNLDEKMSSDKNINNIDKDGTETETSPRSGDKNTNGTGATSFVNNLNKQSEDHTDEKVTLSQTASDPSESGALKQDVEEEATRPRPRVEIKSPRTDAESTDIKISKEERPKMNIELEAGRPETSAHQSVSENYPGHSSSEKSANEQADEDQAQDNLNKDGVQTGNETAKTDRESNLKGEDDPNKVDEHCDKTDDNCTGGGEKEKSDSENEEKAELLTERLTGKGTAPNEEVKKINTGQGESSIDPPGSSSEEERSDVLEASGGAENAKEKKAAERKDEDKNLKPSSFLPKRLACIRRQWSDYDTRMYRDCYPGKPDFPELTKNLDFYQGKIKCEPNGDYIDTIHVEWWGDYEWLEIHHGYIQWLFPIRETGMNYQAQELQLHEAEAIRADSEAMERVKLSYMMMLDFYGIHLVNKETGEVDRADNWKKRFNHLNYSMHNYLRITRILKCLGELGLERFKSPFLHFVLHEAIVTGYLDRTLDSCYNFWIGTVKDDEERESIYDYALHLSALEEETELSDVLDFSMKKDL